MINLYQRSRIKYRIYNPNPSRMKTTWRYYGMRYIWTDTRNGNTFIELKNKKFLIANPLKDSKGIFYIINKS